MIFEYTINFDKVEKENKKIISRVAVRAVIIKDNDILMVKTNKGDYKFPGGGVSKNENFEEALKREVLEETGFKIINIKEKFGIIDEIKKDIFEKEAVFEMKSIYYLCDISECQHEQNLDEYEKILDFSPVWINFETALHQNLELLNFENNDINPWVKREIFVLKKICEHFKSEDKKDEG
jgi:ADP-ribose pyrophosphatase YjhB (NUDIX family)